MLRSICILNSLNNKIIDSGIMHRLTIGSFLLQPDSLLLHPCQKLMVLKLLPKTYVAVVNPQSNGFKLPSNSLASKKTEVIELLIKRLQCSFEEASDIYELNSDFLLNNESKIEDYVNILGESGILPRTIKENIWIFSFDKVEFLNRLTLFNKCHFTNPNNGICILRLPFKILTKTALHLQADVACGGKNRVSYFASQVQCDEKRACEVFVRYMFMMTLNLETLQQILTMVKAHGVLTEDLLSDLWFFRYSLKFIRKRTKLLDHIGARQKCRSIKPWMLRCDETTLKRYFELKEENIAALGSYSNIKDLLSNELGLSSAEVDEMILKHPPLSKISYSKAKDMIEFLIAEGFSSKMICHVPRVLCHKQATLLARMEEIKKINPQLMNLSNLCRNKKDFILFLKKCTSHNTEATCSEEELR